MSTVIALKAEHAPELMARKASIEATLGAIGQLSLFVTQKEAELTWVKAIERDAAAIGIDVPADDLWGRRALIAKLEESLLALREQKQNTETLSEALQEAFSLRLAVLYGINIQSERWELDLEKAELRRSDKEHVR